ncbi:hypothetical protein EV194_12020 [Natronoflexus pectinivorans]|uniref:Uncharacterized protein n=1 Tax=Natronoflexus pectinivorans TaxID=682526 RepID=A0A4R2G7H0_9BACT|nr:hypothetical protein EV194_12020 [Natronoflexus pectinivorans]
MFQFSYALSRFAGLHYAPSPNLLACHFVSFQPIIAFCLRCTPTTCLLSTKRYFLSTFATFGGVIQSFQNAAITFLLLMTYRPLDLLVL